MVSRLRRRIAEIWTKQKLRFVHPGLLQGFQCRPGTIDESFFRKIVLGNEYRLPRFAPEDLVLDIGSHVGSFLVAAYVQGARRLFGFEPEPSNYAWLQRNLPLLKGAAVKIDPRALWRSDQDDTWLTFETGASEYNTGQRTLMYDQGGPPVATRGLDHAIDEIGQGGAKRIRFLKIDCEGAEFPILLTARKLSQIDEIAGEFHEITPETSDLAKLHASFRVGDVDRFTMELLANHLKREGFHVEYEHHARYANIGWFFAKRK